MISPVTPKPLVLVPLDDFIPKGENPLLLGVWCSAHPGLANAKVVASPYEPPASIIDAEKYVRHLCSAILPVLAARLNFVHGVELGLREWRILAGPWLQLFVSSAYDRYLRLRLALQEHPDLACILMAEGDSRPPHDSIHLAYSLATDRYNLQLMSRLLRAMGATFPERAFPQPPIEEFSTPTSGKQKLLEFACRGLGKLFSAFGSFVLLRDSYLPRIVEIKLAIRSPGKILPWFAASRPTKASAPNASMRVVLEGLQLGTEEFEHCLTRLLPAEIPVSLLEDFKVYSQASEREYPQSVAALCSANAWYYDESFKHAAVRYLRRGAQLLGVQHGGNYGSLDLMPSEDHETEITDRYYTWGWNRNNCHADVRPMPAAKLIRRVQQVPNNSARDLLWVTTSAPRYLLMHPFSPEDFETYLSWQSRFLAALAPQWRDSLRLRPHYEDNGWNLVQRLKSQAPGLRVEGWQQPFSSSLAQCRLYVCDHLSTTFLEALAVGKPTVLFWDEKSNVVRPQAQPYYQQLRDAGILFHSPEAAAAALQQAAVDVEAWWNQPMRKQAVEIFCQRFARTSPDSLQEWEQEFRQVLASREGQACHLSR